MNLTEKKELLARNVWSIKEVQDYFNITPNKWSKVRKFIKERPPFSSSVYRDDVFALLKTSVKQEIQTLRDVEGREL